MDKVRLLIIDEHEAVCQALATRLSSTPPIEIVAATHDIDAVPFFLNGFSDVALLGLRSGSDIDLAVTMEIVAQLTAWKTAVIILTPYADAIEREMVLHAGASRYLLKDINSPQLIAEIMAVAHEKVQAVSGER